MDLAFSATVWPGSPGQKKAGILASATLHVWVGGENIIDLCDWKVRQVSNGMAALPASREGGADPKDPSKRRWFNQYKVFMNDRDRYNEVQQVILNAYYAIQASQPPGQAAPAPVQAGAYPSAAPTEAPKRRPPAPRAAPGPQQTAPAPQQTAPAPAPAPQPTAPAPAPAPAPQALPNNPPAPGGEVWPYGDQ